jgi:NAD(P)-dependent dehydrogenase (short-subunit alcohol dehydrogenase family)
VVAPGAARTPIWDGAAPTAEAFAILDKRISRSIRLGEAEEVANGVVPRLQRSGRGDLRRRRSHRFARRRADPWSLAGKRKIMNPISTFR